jgi:hypothetical protein
MQIARCLSTPIQRVPGFFFRGVKRLGRKTDNSLASSAEVKDEWSCTSTSHLHGVHTDSYVFAFYLTHSQDHSSVLRDVNDNKSFIASLWAIHFFLCGEGPRSRYYGRTAALRLIVQPCDEDD